jgi:uridine kinase
VFIHSIEDLMKVKRSGRFPELIMISEAKEERDITEIACRLNNLSIRVVLLGGPSASGKTTLAKRIRDKAKVLGKELVNNHLDNYYKPHKDMPRDSKGVINFDSPQSLDLDLINSHIKALLKGETVEVPMFDMEKGVRTSQTIPLRLKENQILVIEGTLALYPAIIESIESERKFGIFVNTSPTLRLNSETILSTFDLRLIRRIVRDAKFRGIEAIKTIRQWPSVKEGELKYILPTIENADLVEDTYLPYELPILKFHAMPLLEEAELQAKQENEGLWFKK